jgi:hypothetical protein
MLYSYRCVLQDELVNGLLLRVSGYTTALTLHTALQLPI